MADIVLNTGDTAWVLASTALVLLMTPGLALFYGGMVRAKSVLNMMLMSMVTIGIVSVLWVIYGFKLAFGYEANSQWYGEISLSGLGSAVNELTTAPCPEENKVVAQQHINAVHRQLSEYFSGQRQAFELALAPKGTVFQHQVWQALAQLHFGQVCSYGDIANRIHRPKAVRAVGAANGANPIAIIVPCHRVIGKNGKLTGYAYGLEMKQFLLALEVRG